MSLKASASVAVDLLHFHAPVLSVANAPASDNTVVKTPASVVDIVRAPASVVVDVADFTAPVVIVANAPASIVGVVRTPASVAMNVVYFLLELMLPWL